MNIQLCQDTIQGKYKKQLSGVKLALCAKIPEKTNSSKYKTQIKAHTGISRTTVLYKKMKPHKI